MPFRKVLSGCCLGTFILCQSHTSLANGNPPSAANFTLGEVNHGHSLPTGNLNPASVSAYRERSDAMRGAFNIGANIGYGNLDEIFDLYNQIASEVEPGDPEGDPESPEHLPSNPNFDDIIAKYPELEELIDKVVDKATFLAAALVLIKVEGYATATTDGELSVLISDDIAGGSLTFNTQANANIKALGIIDSFNTNKDYIVDQLKAAYALEPGDPITEFRLGDGLNLTVNPDTGEYDLDFYNDSLLLTKSAKMASFSLGYSREAFSNQHGSLFWGFEPKIYRVGLSQIDHRFGDLRDSKSLFEDIKNTSHSYDTAVSLDLGVYWQADHYALGFTLNDPFQPNFEFPDIDMSRYQDSEIIQRLESESTYQIKRQGRIESSLFNSSQNLSAHLALDTNRYYTPMGDKYQWFTAGVGYKTSYWWVPSLRAGYRKNLVGDELDYIGVGANFFRYLDLDIGTSLETVTLDGDTVPRSLTVSLGAQFNF